MPGVLRTKCLCASDLKNRFDVQKNSPTTNVDGQKVEAWANQFRVWGRLTARGGMERRVFEQMQAECDYVIQLLWSKKARDISPADYRFVDVEDGRVFNIAAVFDPDGMKRQLQAHCTVAVDGE